MRARNSERGERSSLRSLMLGLLAVVGLFASLSPLNAAELLAREAPKEIAAPPAGTLFICGGGKLSDELLQQFVKLSGGDEGKLVVITTANWRAETAPEEVLAMWQPRTKAAITLLHARSAEEANRDDFLAPLRTATGVWLMSGKQSRLTGAYLGTKLHDELRAVLARGGVVGGTSAGAAAMSDVMIAGGTLDAPGILPGFALLEDSIIDQHFMVRKREPRLLKTLHDYPGRVGFGIDEGTALVVRGRDLFVLGESTVSVYLAPSETRPLRTTLLKAGEREDLTAPRRAALARTTESFPPEKLPLPRVADGSLVIVGGGRMPDDVQKKFVELCGGPKAKIIVVPAAGDRPTADSAEGRWLTKHGVTKIEVFHPRDRDEANSPEFITKLRDAGGIWFGGGRQWRTVDAFEGTASVAAFHDVLKRGGAIGGSSAGATIQGEYLVRGNPIGNLQIMAEGYERGFGFLPGTAIDQHFTQRKRQPDMLLLKRTFPQLLGLGIDEGTAVIVRGSRLDVMGEAQVGIYPPVRSGATLPDPHILKAGESFDLETLAAE